VLEVKALNQFYGGSHHVVGCGSCRLRRSRMCLMGRNGMGRRRSSDASWVCSRRVPAASHSTESLCSVSRRAGGQGLASVTCRQGREIFSHLTVEENLRVGLGVRRNGSPTIPSRIFDLFPALKQMLTGWR